MKTPSASFGHLAVVVMTAAIGVSVAAVAGAAASTPPPTVSNYTATPDQLTSAGGKLVLRADTTRATTCKFSSTYAITGLPVTEPCPGGHPGHTLNIGPNTGNDPKNIDFTLKAIGPGGSASATLYIHEEPRAPVIKSFKASAGMLPSSGGKLTLTAKVKRANKCIISSKPNVSGLPVGLDCTSGTLTKTVTLPATTSGKAGVYTFALTAAGLGQTVASAQTTVFVKAQTPTVGDFTATPSRLPASGGTVTLSAKVTNAVGCNYGDSWVGGDPASPNPVSKFPESIKCRSGTITLKVTVTADKSKLGEKITFEMTVNSQSAVVDAKQTPVVKQKGA